MNYDLAWTLQQALEAQRAAEKVGETGSATPLHQWAACLHLVEESKRFASGDKMALLAAICICANHDEMCRTRGAA